MIIVTEVGAPGRVFPTKFALEQNFPNPLNPATRIAFSVPGSGFVSLRVFDLLGREVATLVNERKQPGNYTVEWNAENLPSGVYIYKLQSGKFSASRKLLVVK